MHACYHLKLYSKVLSCSFESCPYPIPYPIIYWSVKLTRRNHWIPCKRGIRIHLSSEVYRSAIPTEKPWGRERTIVVTIIAVVKYSSSVPIPTRPTTSLETFIQCVRNSLVSSRIILGFSRSLTLSAAQSKLHSSASRSVMPFTITCVIFSTPTCIYSYVYSRSAVIMQLRTCSRLTYGEHLETRMYIYVYTYICIVTCEQASSLKLLLHSI